MHVQQCGAILEQHLKKESPANCPTLKKVTRQMFTGQFSAGQLSTSQLSRINSQWGVPQGGFML